MKHQNQAKSGLRRLAGIRHRQALHKTQKTRYNNMHRLAVKHMPPGGSVSITPNYPKIIAENTKIYEIPEYMHSNSHTFHTNNNTK